MPKKNKQVIIGLVDADLLNGGTRHPNLALMKIAGFLRDNNIPFELITDANANIQKFKYIYMSKVFSFTPDPSFYQNANTRGKSKFRIGGTGGYATKTNVKQFAKERRKDMTKLENDPFLSKLQNKYGGRYPETGIVMARQMPFYDLYEPYILEKIAKGRKESYYEDYLSFSIGFLTRGCFRHCPFCINKLENTILPYSELSWFVDQERGNDGKLKRPYIYLWDDNFLASDPSVWRPLLKSLQELGKPFQFRQGLDERIIAEKEYGPEIAETLSKCKYHGDFIFAFDNWGDREKIVKALKIWKRYNPKKGTKFYLFCGFKQNATNLERFYKDIWELFQRIRILMQYGCVGYVMRHEDYHNSPLPNIYVQIARWCNQQAFYKKMSFWEFCYRNQSYWEEQTLHITNRPALKTFEEFNADFNNGYYNSVKMCLPLKSFVIFLNLFQDHRSELLEMFNFKMELLKDPSLWNINK